MEWLGEIVFCKDYEVFDYANDIKAWTPGRGKKIEPGGLFRNLQNSKGNEFVDYFNEYRCFEDLDNIKSNLSLICNSLDIYYNSENSVHAGAALHNLLSLVNFSNLKFSWSIQAGQMYYKYNSNKLIPLIALEVFEMIRLDNLFKQCDCGKWYIKRTNSKKCKDCPQPTRQPGYKKEENALRVFKHRLAEKYKKGSFKYKDELEKYKKERNIL